MPYNPNIHNRKSIRLKGYDYAKAGSYFITICVQDRLCLFGHIVNGEMILNDAGRMIEKWYYALETKFHDIKCHEMVIMPNHFHCIITNVGTAGTAGADQRVCPNNIIDPNNIIKSNEILTTVNNHPISGDHTGSTLYSVVQWFKTMSTNEYIRGVKQHGWTPFNGKLWQRNYWENIIRDKQSFERITQYIINNPKKWDIDKFSS